MTKKNTSVLGGKGEELATIYLKKKGYRILERNYSRAYGFLKGELDIIAFDKKENCLVFVEVKTRSLSSHYQTLPEENITPAKLRKLARIANIYLKEKKKGSADFRFDAVSILIDHESKKAIVKHIPCL